MTTREDSAGSHSSSKHDPAATDLDYYSKPENYTGSSLQAFQRFAVDKSKEEKNLLENEKKRVVKDEKYYFFHRYKHILKDVIFIEDLIDEEKDESSDEGEADDRSEHDRKSGGKTPAADALHTITEEGHDDGKYLFRYFEQAVKFWVRLLMQMLSKDSGFRLLVWTYWRNVTRSTEVPRAYTRTMLTRSCCLNFEL